MIGNLESRDASLADCMVELLKCARTIENLEPLYGEDPSFADHAKAEFRKSFHQMNTDYHFLALFLHPLCRRLALSNKRLSRTYADVVRIALKLAKKLGWSKEAAQQLTRDLHEYNLAKGPFSGGLADGQAWWENMAVTASSRPIKSMAIILFSVVPHAAEVERLFSDLASIEGDKRTNFNVDTLLTLGRLRCNYRDMIQNYRRATGNSVRRRHAHMHTRAEPGIDEASVTSLEKDVSEMAPEDMATHTEEDLERSFELLRRGDAEDWREGRSDEEIEFLERVRTASVSDCFDLSELDNVAAQQAPSSLETDIHVHKGGAGSTTGWSIDSLLMSAGL